uniref:Transmembrane protein n=1 Tax=Solanum lycopersicum TaxID=4081 RepID=A0A3Q7GWL7_SOLLC
MAIVNQKTHWFLIMSFIFFFFLITCQARNLQVDNCELVQKNGNQQVVISTKEKSEYEDSVAIDIDYTPARKKPPIHN